MKARIEDRTETPRREFLRRLGSAALVAAGASAATGYLLSRPEPDAGTGGMPAFGDYSSPAVPSSFIGFRMVTIARSG